MNNNPDIGFKAGQMSSQMEKFSWEVMDNIDIAIADYTTWKPDNISFDCIRERTQRGQLTFLVMGQRLMDEQGEARRRELKAIGAGAISLGASKFDPERIYPIITNIFSGEGNLDDKIEKVQQALFLPVVEEREYRGVANWIENGGSLELGKYLYNDFKAWLAVKNSAEYKPLAEAMQLAGEGIVDSVFNEMRRREIVDFVSMGPTPSVEKFMLEKFAKEKTQVRYHAVDVSSNALIQTKHALTDYLNDRVPGWEKYVTLVETKPTLFEDYQTEDASCVSFPGGQVMNSDNLLGVGSKICKPDGLVLADVHHRGSEEDSEYWRSFYESKAIHNMMRKGILYALPHLGKKTGWDTSVKYIQEDGVYRISFQVDLDREIEVGFNATRFVMRPGLQRELIHSKKLTSQQILNLLNSKDFEPLLLNKVPIQRTGYNARGYGTSVLMSYQPQGVKTQESQTLENKTELVLQASNT
tara:strand:- start:319 stop:1728 length:1410 start_codon:yes stop_codon:yes gene_type:complete